MIQWMMSQYTKTPFSTTYCKMNQVIPSQPSWINQFFWYKKIKKHVINDKPHEWAVISTFDDFNGHHDICIFQDPWL